MLTVTEAASAHLSQLLKQRDEPEGIAVRLVDDGKMVDDGQSIALEPDSERAGDTTFQHEGQTVLLMDAQVSQLLAEDTLNLEGGKLTLQPPMESA